MAEPRKVVLKRFLTRVEAELSAIRDPERSLPAVLRRLLAETARFFAADDAALIGMPVAPGHAPLQFQVAPKVPVARGDLDDYFQKQMRLAADGRRLVLPIERRERLWALLLLRRAAGFSLGTMHEAAEVAHAIGRMLHALDERRVAEVRERIDRKISEKLRPQDLFYQILDGLRLLTRYDHSSALLLHHADHGRLDLVSEQVAWRKGRSHRIGATFPLDAGLRATLEAGATFGFDRHGDGWRGWKGDEPPALAQFLDWSDTLPDPEKPAQEGVILVAPLATRQGLLGVFKIAARTNGLLGPWEAKVVQRFLLQAAVAIQFLRRAESLELELRHMVKKQAMANVALGVAHDINNAVGAVLPLVQQMVSDADGGVIAPATLRQDLGLIEESMRKCRRIAGRMLSFARGAARVLGEGNLKRAVESTLALVKDEAMRRRVTVAVALAPELPLVRGNPADLEQLVLNLVTNALDAMPAGGRLGLRAQPDDGHVRLEVEDSGVGISPENLRRLQEPFFTTKRDGTGLGLSICRAIVWKMRGDFHIESEVGRFTRVTARLPVAVAATQAQTLGSGPEEETP